MSASPAQLSELETEEAPFATPTLARLYLAQGHTEAARRLAARLKAEGSPTVSLEQALGREDTRRQALLESLLERVRQNRR